MMEEYSSTKKRKAVDESTSSNGLYSAEWCKRSRDELLPSDIKNNTPSKSNTGCSSSPRSSSNSRPAAVVGDHFNQTGENKLQRHEESSVESLLLVPVSFIFRQVPSNANNAGVDIDRKSSPFATSLPSTTGPTVWQNYDNKRRSKPLLSRSEAHCFCRINLLAYELDSLTETCTTAITQQMQCRDLTHFLQSVDHPYLRPILPILCTIQHMHSIRGMHHINMELHRVTTELQETATILRQCSEQNWTLAETLQYTTDEAGQLLATEKQKLSDIEEEICQRIDCLLNCSNPTTVVSTGSDQYVESFVEAHDSTSNLSRRTVTDRTQISMQEYCAQILMVNESTTTDAATVEESLVAAHSVSDKAIGPSVAEDELLSEPADEVVEESYKYQYEFPTPEAVRKPSGKTSSCPSLSKHHVSTTATTTTTTTKTNVYSSNQKDKSSQSPSSATTSITPHLYQTSQIHFSNKESPIFKMAGHTTPYSDEKENSQLQQQQESVSSSSFSSQHSSQRPSLHATTTATTTTTATSLPPVIPAGIGGNFESQNAAEVLSTMAFLSGTGTK